MNSWIKKRALQSKCPHQWHEIDQQCKGGFWTEFYWVTFLYCPFCDKTTKLKRDKATQTLRKQDVKNRYGSNY